MSSLEEQKEAVLEEVALGPEDTSWACVEKAKMVGS